MTLSSDFLHRCRLRDLAFAVHTNDKMSQEEKEKALASLQEQHDATLPK